MVYSNVIAFCLPLEFIFNLERRKIRTHLVMFSNQGAAFTKSSPDNIYIYIVQLCTSFIYISGLKKNSLM